LFSLLFGAVGFPFSFTIVSQGPQSGHGGHVTETTAVHGSTAQLGSQDTLLAIRGPGHVPWTHAISYTGLHHGVGMLHWGVCISTRVTDLATNRNAAGRCAADVS
jgi:hypothetical protein